MHETQPLRFSPFGEAAIHCDAAGEKLDHAVQERIWSLAELAAGWPHVREAVPGMNNLLLVYIQNPLYVEYTIHILPYHYYF